ncbi:hypothetical protein M2459_002476 [Parabacteroides sp. PF5-5]|uniref:hypothetical protein n=1 Tax=unclassified Parabacteroides TaxID=2649774 RepID=UPI0024770A12|nr:MULTISPECIES: hypothetical protein [unclassified Parabacteroides]MDH6305768.1 hypothetical protein [Parabacteroides sp. PH5-39]MDH6316840.1 hypothetical protein [Parabacteroides sp. PF5-13]MDH6320481.1 hypothetical protein [Parabacteroides sp. PH5-13]MDH6324211.1 hypothetical protein [Parabacteroides sp. PH5-8]MDH6328026.1 hypothetical protein [Parabacteroides sp. PH5-41]
MKQKRLFLTVVFLSALFTTVLAQSDFSLTVNKEGKIVVIPKMRDYELKVPELSYKTYTPSSRFEIETKLREFMPEIQPGFDERPMDMQVLSAAYRPFFNIYAPMLRRISPMAFDFSETVVVPTNENLAFFTTGSQYSWPGLGGLTTINPGMAWSLDKWTVTGGGFAGRFFTPFNPSPGYLGGVNMQVRYDINERLALRTWGQYAFYNDSEKNNPHMLMNPYFNHTNVGGAVEFMINENFGIGAGVNYEFNPRLRKMEPQYLIFPVFRSKNVKVGIW